MNADGVISAIPNMDEEKRRIIRQRATLLASENSLQKRLAERVRSASRSVEADEDQNLRRHVESLLEEERIIQAFQAKPMSEVERKVVQVLLDRPGASSSTLTQALGWEGMSWHLHFGTMCSNRLRNLWPGPQAESPGPDFFCGILADFDEQTRGFTMKPHAVEAFAALGLRGAISA